MRRIPDFFATMLAISLAWISTRVTEHPIRHWSMSRGILVLDFWINLIPLQSMESTRASYWIGCRLFYRDGIFVIR